MIGNFSFNLTWTFNYSTFDQNTNTIYFSCEQMFAVSSNGGSSDLLQAGRVFWLLSIRLLNCPVIVVLQDKSPIQRLISIPSLIINYQTDYNNSVGVSTRSRKMQCSGTLRDTRKLFETKAGNVNNRLHFPPRFQNNVDNITHKKYTTGADLGVVLYWHATQAKLPKKF